jgi:DNA invertase Pin-like site-specific DNA recombinase
MATAHIYVRVSTDKQDLSPEWQRNVCCSYFEQELAKRGFTLNPTIFEDIGQSAYKIPWAEREVGKHLFTTIKSGDIVIIAKQDRAWRTVRDKENCLFLFRQLGIGIAILDANLDTSTAAGKFASGIMALQAQWESDIRSERMKAALHVRRQRRTPSKRRPPPGWMYDYAREELVPDLRERKLLDLIYSWRADRVRSVKQTCRWLTDNGIRRVSGSKYNVQWVQRAWMARQKGWPLEGYVQSFWRDRTVPEHEKWKFRLPRIDGKKHVNFHPRRLRCVAAADLRWLGAAYFDGTPPSLETASPGGDTVAPSEDS